MNRFTAEMKTENSPEDLVAIPSDAGYRLARRCLFCAFFDIQEYPKGCTKEQVKLGPCKKWECWVASDGICSQYE